MNIFFGVVGGVAGAAAMTVVMMNLDMPLSPPEMVASKVFGTAEPSPPQFLGIHFANGTLLGGVYAGIVSLAGVSGGVSAHAAYGTIYSLVMPWLVLGLVMLPMEGHGLFGREVSGKLLPMTLLLHVIFGAVLGAVFGFLV